MGTLSQRPWGEDLQRSLVPSNIAFLVQTIVLSPSPAGPQIVPGVVSGKPHGNWVPSVVVPLDLRK